MKIKDPIALGAISGVLGSLSHLLLNFLSVQSGYSKFYSFQIAAGVFIAKDLTSKTMGLIIGAISWTIVSILLGVLTVLLFKFTGKDFWWLKGILITGALTYTGVFGVIFAMGGSNLNPTDIPTTLTSLLGNVVYGIFMGYLVLKLGDIKEIKIFFK